jgi:hypothetical protein
MHRVFRQPAGFAGGERNRGVSPASRMPAAAQAQPPAFADRVIVLDPQRADRPDARGRLSSAAAGTTTAAYGVNA